jgi:hypothetical protein
MVDGNATQKGPEKTVVEVGTNRVKSYVFAA